MPQIHHIDSDEEITSLVDRLRKSKSRDNYFVVPQRSMIFQSLVNLKLFKRESQKMKKKVCLVTQNDLILSLAKKVNLETMNSLENVQLSENSNTGIQKTAIAREIENSNASVISDKRNYLENIGTSDFYGTEDVSPSVQNLETIIKTPKKAIGKYSNQLARNDFFGSPMKMSDMLPLEKNSVEADEVILKNVEEDTKLDDYKEKKIKSLFSEESSIFQASNQEFESKKNMDDQQKTTVAVKVKIPKGFKKVILLFVFICVVLLGLVSAYLYLPEVEVQIYPSYRKINADFTIRNYQNQEKIDFEIKGAKIIKIQETKKIDFKATGSTGASNKKAKGKVVIFNEFSSAPQTLVATTRLLSQEGKIFRLDRKVIVPGMSRVGEQMKPGAVEVDVTADESGSEYNIKPGKFTIPGFQGSQKYEKFYAKSEKPMSGGGDDTTMLKSVTQEDIDRADKEAKKYIEEELRKILAEKIEKGYKLVSGTETFSIIRSGTSSRAGDLQEDFEYSITAELTAYTVDVNEMAEYSQKYLKLKNKDLENFQLVEIEFETRQPEFNFETEKLISKIHVKATYRPLIDLELFKREILGKNEQEVIEIARREGKISKIEIIHRPNFLTSKVPQHERRIQVKIIESIDKN